MFWWNGQKRPKKIWCSATLLQYVHLIIPVVWESVTSYLYRIYVASYLLYSYPGARFAQKMGHTSKSALNSCFCVCFQCMPSNLNYTPQLLSEVNAHLFCCTGIKREKRIHLPCSPHTGLNTNTCVLYMWRRFRSKGNGGKRNKTSGGQRDRGDIWREQLESVEERGYDSGRKVMCSPSWDKFSAFSGRHTLSLLSPSDRKFVELLLVLGCYSGPPESKIKLTAQNHNHNQSKV